MGIFIRKHQEDLFGLTFEVPLLDQKGFKDNWLEGCIQCFIEDVKEKEIQTKLHKEDLQRYQVLLQLCA